MNDFLTTIRIPELQNPNFQSQFNDFCIAIRQNFEKLMSVQYTRGEKGASIETHYVKLISDENVLTSLGAKVFNSIFHTEAFLPGNTWNEVKQVLDPDNIEAADPLAPRISKESDRYVVDWDSMKKLELAVFVDPTEGLAWLANPFIFIDNRIEDLSNYQRWLELKDKEASKLTDNDLRNFVTNLTKDKQVYETFRDFSCAVFGGGTYYTETISGKVPNGSTEDAATWNWVCNSSDIVPKLYFDEDIKEFCWKVNGQETSVTAQGVRGTDGRSPKIHICKGILKNNYIDIISVEHIDSTTQELKRTWDTYTSNPGSDDINTYEEVKDGDMVLVYYKPTDSDMWKAYLGNAVCVAEDSKKVFIGSAMDESDPRVDLFYSIMNMSITQMMDSVHYGNDDVNTSNGNTENSPRGYFLRDCDAPTYKYHLLYVDYDLDQFTNDIVHTGRLRLSPVTGSGIIGCDKTNHSPSDGHIGDLQVDYNTTISGNQEVRGDQVVKGSQKVDGSVGIGGDVNITGDLSVTGQATVDNLRVTGEFRQEGSIKSSLDVVGTQIGGTILGQQLGSEGGAGKDVQDSKFALACITEIRDIKPKFEVIKLKPHTRNASIFNLAESIAGNRRTYGSGSASQMYQQITRSSTDTNVYATHKVYVGASFILNLKMGYLGYGAKILKEGQYMRNGVTANSGAYGESDGKEYLKSNMYNACEYNIPCYVQTQLYAAMEDTSSDNKCADFKFFNKNEIQYNTETGEIYVPKEYAYGHGSPIFFQFNHTPTPITYEGKTYNININLGGQVYAKYEVRESTNPINWTTNQIIKIPLTMCIYQGIVDMSNNKAFYLKNSSIPASVVDNTCAPVIYTTNSGYLTNNAFLFPYLIAEQKYPSLAQQQSPRAGDVTSYDSVGGDWGKGYTQAMVKKFYAGIPLIAGATADVTMTLTKSGETVYYTYGSTVTNISSRPQRYLSIFNTGKMSNGLQPVECEMKVNRIFRFQDTEVYDSNVNVYMKRISGDDIISESFDTWMDDDIYENMETTSDRKVYTGENKDNFLYTMELQRGHEGYVAINSSFVYDTNNPCSPRYSRGDNTIHLLGASILYLSQSDTAGDLINTTILAQTADLQNGTRTVYEEIADSITLNLNSSGKNLLG